MSHRHMPSGQPAADALPLVSVAGSSWPVDGLRSLFNRLLPAARVQLLLAVVTAICAPLLPIVCRVTCGLSLLIWLVGLRRREGWVSVWAWRPLRWLLAFIGWILLSLVWAPDVSKALKDLWVLRHLLWAVPLTLLVVAQPAVGRWLIGGLVAGLLVVAGVSIVGRVALGFGVELPFWLWRPWSGTLRNSYIDMGVFLPWVAFALTAWGLRQVGWQRLAAVVLAGVVLVDINLAYAGRIALVSTVVALGVGVACWPATVRVKALLVLAQVVLLVVSLQGPAWSGRSPTRQLERWHRSGELSSTPIRLEIWRCATNVWLERPLFGGGPGARPFYQDQLCRFSDEGVRELHRTWSAHQQYLDVLAAQGLVGLGLFLAWMGQVLTASWRIRRTWQGSTLLAGLSILLVGSLFNSFLLDLSTRYAWVLLAACAMASARPASDLDPAFDGPDRSRGRPGDQ